MMAHLALLQPLWTTFLKHWARATRHNKKIQLDSVLCFDLPDSLWCQGLLIALFFFFFFCTVSSFDSRTQTTGCESPQHSPSFTHTHTYCLLASHKPSHTCTHTHTGCIYFALVSLPPHHSLAGGIVSASIKKKNTAKRKKKSIKPNKQEWELLPACLHSPPHNRNGSTIRFLYNLPHRGVTEFTFPFLHLDSAFGTSQCYVIWSQWII